MASEHILGLRQDDRRHADRRHAQRDGMPERRRGDRRRRTLRGLVLGMFAMALPHAAGGSKSAEFLNQPEGFVSVSEDYRAVPAAIAYNEAIAEAANQYHLDPNLIRAIIHAESAFNPFAVSSAGALGLMQLMPAMAEELDVVDPFDPRQNILGGARYLRDLLDRHHGNVNLAVASYNAGPGAVARYKGVPPYRETRNYVKTVNAFIKQARSSDSD
jgi:soluble lytic murein transglycosylase-like protein